MKGPADEKLLSEHLAGKAEAFELLVRRHSQELYHFLVRFTGSSATAEDVVQEAFLQVHLSAGAFDPKRRFKPWLFTIAANKARDLLRRKARRPEIPLDAHVGDDEDAHRFGELLADTQETPSEIVDAEEQRKIVRRVVNSLPDHLREVLVLSYYHRFPYKDLAEILGIPLGTVKSRLHAAVGHFGKAYEMVIRQADGANQTPTDDVETSR